MVRTDKATMASALYDLESIGASLREKGTLKGVLRQVLRNGIIGMWEFGQSGLQATFREDDLSELCEKLRKSTAISGQFNRIYLAEAGASALSMFTTPFQ